MTLPAAFVARVEQLCAEHKLTVTRTLSYRRDLGSAYYIRAVTHTPRRETVGVYVPRTADQPAPVTQAERLSLLLERAAWPGEEWTDWAARVGRDPELHSTRTAWAPRQQLRRRLIAVLGWATYVELQGLRLDRRFDP